MGVCTCRPPPLSNCFPFSSVLHHLRFEDNDLSGSLLISFSPFYLLHQFGSLFYSHPAMNQDLRTPLSPECVWEQKYTSHLKKNDIIFLLHSQSDASTWSAAFMEALCAQDRQTEMGNYRETDVQNDRYVFYFI